MKLSKKAKRNIQIMNFIKNVAKMLPYSMPRIDIHEKAIRMNIRMDVEREQLARRKAKK